MRAFIAAVLMAALPVAAAPTCTPTLLWSWDGASRSPSQVGPLATKKLVLGPDHRGGCYLIAFHSSHRELLRGIRWKQNTDCAQLRDRCGDERLFLLPVKHDLDSWADVRIFARGGDPLARVATFLLEVICETGARIVHFVSSASQQMRVRQQMPPPAFAA